jgi:putative transposase
MKHSEWNRQSDDLALARYSVIAPLVCRQLSDAEKGDMRQEILGAVHVFPDGPRKVSIRSLNRWAQWYLHGHSDEEGEILSEPGIEALRSLPRHDKGLPRALEDALVERAVALRREEPSRSTSVLIELLKSEAAREGRELGSVKEATLAYHLRRRRATKRELKREGRVFRRYQQDRRNATWQGDWSQGIPIADPSSPGKLRLCHLHAFLDDHTRFVVHAEFYFRQNLPCLEDCFRKAILAGGVPERVYWDNGAVYHSRQIQQVAARLQTQVIFSTPYAPEGKGKIERWFRTVKDAFYPEARAAGITSLAQLNEFFWGWLERSYQLRVHSETELTPRSAWEKGIPLVRHPDPARLGDLFLWEAERLVDKTGCIHLSGNAYPVSEHLVGQKVQVRFDPFDISRVRLYEGGALSQILEPQTLVSQTFRKAKKQQKETPASRKSSVDYREQMSAEVRARTNDTLRQVRGDRTSFLSQAEFFAMFQTHLAGRNLSSAEARSVESFLAKNAPLGAADVEAALATAVEDKGTRRHLRFYLDRIQSTRLAEGRE